MRELQVDSIAQQSRADAVFINGNGLRASICVAQPRYWPAKSKSMRVDARNPKRRRRNLRPRRQALGGEGMSDAEFCVIGMIVCVILMALCQNEPWGE